MRPGVIVLGNLGELRVREREVHVVATPGEVLWLLDGGAEVGAIVIDGDVASPEHFQLLAYLRTRYPGIVPVLAIERPEVGRRDGCVVLDRDRLHEELAFVLP